MIGVVWAVMGVLWLLDRLVVPLPPYVWLPTTAIVCGASFLWAIGQAGLTARSRRGP